VKIGLDICFWKIDRAGGIQTLLVNEILALDALLALRDDLEIYLFGTVENLSYFEGKLENIKKVEVSQTTENILQRFLCEQVYLPIATWKSRVDLIHTFNYFGSLFLPCKSIISILDMNYVATPKTFKFYQRLIRSIMVRFSVLRASGIMTISNFSKQEILKYIKTSLPIFPIYLAANYEPISKDSIEYRTSGSYFLSVGSSHPHKNLLGLLDAYEIYLNKRMEKNRPPKLLKVVGLAKKGHDEFLNRIKSAGLLEYVKVLGFVSTKDLRNLYFRAEALIFPSMYEGFGIPPLEAMGLGCPVICSKSASLPEVVGDAAWLVNGKDPFEIAGAMEGIEDKNVRRKLQERGLERAHSFSWDRSARLLVDMYEKSVIHF